MYNTLVANPYQPPVQAAPEPTEPPVQFSGKVSALDALKFPFRHGDWKMNLLLGGVLFLIPVVGPLCVLGWSAEITQRLARKEPEPLPQFDFSDFVHYLQRGLVPFLVALVFQLPLLLVVYGSIVVMVLLAAAAGDLAPIILGVGGLVVWVLALLMALLAQVAQLRADLSEDFGTAFSFGALFSFLKATFWPLLLHTFVFGLLCIPLVLLGYLACGIGLYPAIVIMSLGQTYLRWQVYEGYLAGGGTPFPIKEKQWLPSDTKRYYAQQSQYGFGQQTPPPGPGAGG